MKNLHLFGIVTLGSILSACGGGSSSGNGGTPMPVNQAPSASATTATILQDSGSVDITLSGTDPEGSALTFAISAQPSNGSAALNNNVVTYTPNDGYAGADSFTFTVNDGSLTSGAANVDITVPAASKFLGEVNKPDGTDVPSPTLLALDSDGNEVITVLGETDGTFSLNAMTGQDLTLKFSADGFTDQVIPITMPTQQSTNLPIDVVMTERGVEQTLDIDTGGSLLGDNGASVTLTAGSFVDSNGAAVTGNITATLTPVDISDSQILQAFPGDFTGIVEMSGQESTIASLGTVEYIFTQNGQPLQLNQGATADIELPIYSPINPDTDNPIEIGDEIALWFLNEDTGIWEQEGTGEVVVNASSPTGLALRASVSHFSWWNVDVAIQTATVSVTLTGTTNSGSAVIFGQAQTKRGFRTANRNIAVGQTATGLFIPANTETCFWIEYVDPNGNAGVSGEQCIAAPVPNSDNPLTFTASLPGPLVLVDDNVFQDSHFPMAPVSIPIFPFTLESTVTYAITNGALPAGVTLSNDGPTRGIISGSTPEIGTYNVTVTGTDSDGNTDSKTIEFSVIDLPPPTLEGEVTLFANSGDDVVQTITAVMTPANDPTSWIITNLDGTQVPSNVSISSAGDFTITNYDGTSVSYLVTAFNERGASNALMVNVDDASLAPPILPATMDYFYFLGDSITDDLSVLNSGNPATSWTITNPNGSSAPSNFSISNAGILTASPAAFFETYHVIAFNGTRPSQPMVVTFTEDMIFDPCDIDPSSCI